jgi:DNA-binding NarL/FixJ family response regulator
MSTPVKRILIADDHDIIRRGVRTLLETKANLEIVAEAATGREALAASKDARPDIAIIDYSLPELNGCDLTLELRRDNPRIEVLIYTMHDREEMILDVLRAGARGFVLKSDTEKHLFAAIDALSIHRPYFSGAISETLLAQYLRSNPQPTFSTLTHREREVVQLIAEGKINKQVAHQLSISIKTVETHRSTAMQKLNLKTTAELVRYAVRNNIVEA